MKANRQEVGSRLKQLRTEKGMTMAQVADALHVSSNAVVNNWEKENKKISPKFLKAYADYFNVPVDWIKYGELKEEKQMDNNDVLATAIIFQALKTEELTLGEVIDHESNIDASINILKMIKERLNEER